MGKYDKHPEYRILWLKAKYPDNMGSAAVVPPPENPNFIRLYYLTSSGFALCDLENKRRKIAQIDGLNDPFELLPVDTRNLKRHDDVEKFRNNYKDKNGFLCFSSNWTNPVLWSHYADKHKGICLGFDILRESVSKVVYVENKIRLSDKVKPTDDLLENLVYHKWHHWRYESEWRMIVPLEDWQRDGELRFWPFDNNLVLREVILGEKCPETVAAMQERVDSQVTVFKARRANKYFAIVPE